MPNASDGNGIGYGRPPKASRFKKGVSGNPAGRRKKVAPGVTDIVDQFINKSVPFTEGGERKTATRREISLKALRKQAIGGSLGAADQIIKVLESKRGRGAGNIIRIIGGLVE